MPTVSVNVDEAGKSCRVENLLGMRAAALRAVRDFFVCRQYTEVTTPVWVRTPALETHIDAVAVSNGYLRTSPEFHMKRLLAGGMKRIWQLGPCFRSGEQGRYHSPEFLMLEWYCVGRDYEFVLSETCDLLKSVARVLTGAARISAADGDIDLEAPVERFSVAEMFEQHAGWNPVDNWDEDRFAVDLVEKIEPLLPRARPAVLIDYPLAESAMARASATIPATAERWELYIGGLELANGCSELTDAVEQRRRFDCCAAARAARGVPVYDRDADFLNALEEGLPSSAGVALGFDRLFMLLAGVADLAAVNPFAVFAGRF